MKKWKSKIKKKIGFLVWVQTQNHIQYPFLAKVKFHFSSCLFMFCEVLKHTVFKMNEKRIEIKLNRAHFFWTHRFNRIYASTCLKASCACECASAKRTIRAASSSSTSRKSWTTRSGTRSESRATTSRPCSPSTTKRRSATCTATPTWRASTSSSAEMGNCYLKKKVNYQLHYQLLLY